MMRNQTFQHQI